MYVKELNTNLIAENRQSLVNNIMSFLLNNNMSVIEYEYVLEINRDDCGCIVRYRNFDDIPSKNVICKHGNKMLIYSQLN